MSQLAMIDVPPQGKKKKALKFDERLALFSWLIDLLGEGRIETIGTQLNRPELEGFDEEGRTRYFLELTNRTTARGGLSDDKLRQYDENIVRHWRAITESRNQASGPIYPKYFQYLSLLFTEIYLDRYFDDAEALTVDLNGYLYEFNKQFAETDRLPEYTPSDLNKIAFWMATGSGKTLLMHVNIRQYIHYVRASERKDALNKIILLTPNEGLSQQHLGEFALSGLDAAIFSKEGQGLFAGSSIEIIDIHKLAETSGDKTVAVDSFEGNNLVLVDEGHRGAGGVVFMGFRDKLCANGFSFEYSATFGQAMRAERDALSKKYAKCILFDYSYRFFYGDGYGKEYRILNLESDNDEETRTLYLTACLLSYYQQLRLYTEKAAAYTPFLVERPLWVFVGGSVNAVRKQDGLDVSDVTDVLLFLARFVDDKTGTVRNLDRLLHGRAGLLDSRGRDLFGDAFGYLVRQNLDGQRLYADILKDLFHASAPAKLHVENLKGAEGEIALRLGGNEPFGVINVGDSAKLTALCATYNELEATVRDFSGSLFRSINSRESRINILIGSKKFTEGWSSWRVSTMGLMNIGKSEGAEIIQLFGRGVRLKGYGFSLKRSGFVTDVQRPPLLPILETLNVFGVRADYMQRFREYLEEEGARPGDPVEIVIPTRQLWSGSPQLQSLALKDGINFKKDGPRPTLGAPPIALTLSPITLDWYPKITEKIAKGIQGQLAAVSAPQEHKLTREHIAFLNIDALTLALIDYKTERAWYNLNISQAAIVELLQNPTWYTLFIPSEELEFTSFARVRVWQEIALALLKKYTDRYYKYRKSEYESPHLCYQSLDSSKANKNLHISHTVTFDGANSTIYSALNQLRTDIEAGKTSDWEQGGLRALFFDKMLYEPLMELTDTSVQIAPPPLNKWEGRFVDDLRAYVAKSPAALASSKLYLLRNQSRGRGLGFFEAGNFYPDFILWIVTEANQKLIFVDPKGIRNLAGFTDPKIRFAAALKERETALDNADITLWSFILSNTPRHLVSWATAQDFAQFDTNNVLFMDEPGYMDRMFKTVSG